jgi:hypothetical protein
MATYVPEFVILNEIVDFRDICEGSTDDTFVILCEDLPERPGRRQKNTPLLMPISIVIFLIKLHL